MMRYKNQIGKVNGDEYSLSDVVHQMEHVITMKKGGSDEP